MQSAPFWPVLGAGSPCVKVVGLNDVHRLDVDAFAWIETRRGARLDIIQRSPIFLLHMNAGRVDKGCDEWHFVHNKARASGG